MFARQARVSTVERDRALTETAERVAIVSVARGKRQSVDRCASYNTEEELASRAQNVDSPQLSIGLATWLLPVTNILFFIRKCSLNSYICTYTYMYIVVIR